MSVRFRHAAYVTMVAIASSAFAGCTTDSPRRPAQRPPGYAQPYPGQHPNQGYPGQYPRGQYPGAQPYPGQPYPGQPPAQQRPPAPPPVASTPPTPPPKPALPPVYDDAINTFNMPALETRIRGLYAEMVAALPSDRQARVKGINFGFTSNPGEVNGYAGCRGSYRHITVTHGMMKVIAHAAQAQANDEIFKTQKFDEAARFVARNARKGVAVPPPPAGFYNPAHQVDGRRVARQRELFDEGVGLTLGHELAHHYLKHVVCSTTITPADLINVVRRNVGAFSQVAEGSADSYGIENLMDTGRRRPQGAHRLAENGGVMKWTFFAKMRGQNPNGIHLDLDRTHPSSSTRVRVLSLTAQSYRAGRRLPTPW